MYDMIIDSHHHYWKYDPVEYDWIDDQMKVIRTDFLPGDLEKVIHDAGVNGVITVQARQTIEETDWLIGLGRKNPFMKGIIGWLPLMDKDTAVYLDHFSGESLLKGVRHVVQGEPDPEFILREDFNRGISLLKNHSLVYDILIFERQLPPAICFADNHPAQQFVLDHIAKPRIMDQEISPWRENIRELAKRSNVSCKVSGMVTEAGYQSWTPGQLRPYFDVVLEAFGPGRLLFGSDWPVSLVATGYKNWMDLVRENISSLSETEQAAIMGGNAIRIYNLQI